MKDEFDQAGPQVVAPGAGRLSIVTTLYRSEKTIAEFVRRSLLAAKQWADNVELIIVDDGSPDRSAEIVRRIVDSDPRVRLVQLSRNFGHHKAIFAGLENATGDLVFLIDSDLEEAPELLLDMLLVAKQNPVDCLYGVQKRRKGGLFERLSGRVFYSIFGILSEVRLPQNVSTLRLMTRRYVLSLLQFRDTNPIFVPLSLLVGYPQAPFNFNKENTSRTSYSIGRRISLTLLSLTAFSGRPLQIMFFVSVLFSAFGLLYGTYVVIQAVTGTPRDGWSSLMAVVVFFFSLNAVFTGLIGLYVKQVLEEVKDRPRSVIQEVYGEVKSTEHLS